MDIELIAESLCGADPALLLGGASGSAADVGLAGRAVAWLADVRSTLFQTAGTNKKRQGSGSILDHAERIAQLSKALDLVAGYVKASQTLSTGAAVNLALAALQEGAHLGKLLSSSQSPATVLAAGFDGSGEEGAVEAVARAVRTKPPGGLLMIPTPFGLMILRRGGSGAMASQDQFVAGVASSGPGLRFHPARPREDGDIERMQPLVLGRVPRERMALGTFWYLACQPKREGDELHAYASLLPFLTGVPTDASAARAADISRLAHWRPMSANLPARGEAIQVVLDGLEFALRISGASASQAATVARFEVRLSAVRQMSCASASTQALVQELALTSCARHAVEASSIKDEDDPRSVAPDLNLAVNELRTKVSSTQSRTMDLPLLSQGPVSVTPTDCEYLFFGAGFQGDALDKAEEFAGQPLSADLLCPPDLSDVGPFEVNTPSELAQLLGRAALSCSRLLNQQNLLKSAPHLCFSLIARVLLSVPLDYTWYVHPSFKWTLEVQNFILDRLHSLVRQLAFSALLLGSAGDVALRAVSAMAAAVVFDAVARQVTDNIPSVLAQALGQRLGLGQGCFASETSEQVITRPSAARARSAILEYFEAASVAGQQPVFLAAEVGETEQRLVNGCSLLLGLGPVRSRAAQLLSGEDPALVSQLPQLAMMRDVAFISQLLSRSGSLPFTAPKGCTQQSVVLTWKSQEGSTSLTVRGLGQGQNTALESLLPVSSHGSKDKQTGAERVLARMKKGLLGLTGAERRGAAASQADPGALIGEKLRTEEDVLFLPSAKLRGFEGLSASEAEVVLTMLLAPYLRIPLLLGFLGTSQRVGALADDRLQGVLEAAVFEPGPWRSTTCPREVPKVIPAPTRSHLATTCGLLINELCNAPQATTTGASSLLQSSLERDTGRAAAAPVGLILFAIRLCCRIYFYAQTLLESDSDPRSSLRVALALGAGRPCLEAALGPLQKQLLSARRSLQRWAAEAAEHRKAGLASAVWCHLAMIQSSLGWKEKTSKGAEGEAPVALLAAQLLTSMHVHVERHELRSSISEIVLSPHASSVSQSGPAVDQDPLGGASASEMFTIFAEERDALTEWLRRGGSKAATALEQAVAIASLSTETDFSSNVGLWTEIRPGVFMRAAEAPSQDKLKLKAGESVEEYLQKVASLPKLAFDTNLGSFAMQQGELQVLPGWAVNCPELQELFGPERLQGVLASLVQRTEHRECLNLAGERCDMHRWTPDPRPWPIQTSARDARCSWLDEAVKTAGGFPASLGAPRLLDATDRMARLACELEGLEVIVIRDPPVLQIFEQLSHARMIYKKLRWTSDACWCLSSFPLQEPWCAESGVWNLCSGEGGLPGSSVKQQPAPPSQETVLIVREQTQDQDKDAFDVGAKGGRETLLPSTLMRGLLPEALLRAFRFWRGCDGILRAEEKNPTQGLPPKLQVEPLDGNRAKVVRLLPSQTLPSLAQGKPCRQVLVNLMLCSSSSPLRRLAEMLIRVEDLAFILCWADEAGHIVEIELPRLGLRFKANAKGGLECLGFGGLCIGVDDLSGLPFRVRHMLAQFGGAALLLKGPDGELGVLCSALQRPRRPGGGPFPLEWVAPLVFDRSESISSRSNEKSGHYFFSIHPSHCYVSAQDLAAELYRLTCCWLMHRYEEVVRASSFLGCDGLTQEEAELWNRLGTETSHDQHVDAQACRLHLSTALQPLGLDPPWSTRDAYIQFVLNRQRCSASCILPPEVELQVIQMLPELDGISWLLRNRKRVLEAPSGVLVALEPPPTAPGDGYEVRVFSEAATPDWANAVSVVTPAEEISKTGAAALRYIDQQLSSAGSNCLPMQLVFEMLTRATMLQPFPEDPPHMVAACLARAYGPASAALALLARDEGLAESLPKPPKKQGLLPSAAQKRWLHEVREKLAAAVSNPLPEPPAPAAVPREVLLKHDALRLAAWPLVQVSDCERRCVSGVASLRMPLQEIAQGLLSRVHLPQEIPDFASWVLQKIQADNHCTSRGAQWVNRLQNSLTELQMPSQAAVLRCGMAEIANALQRQLNFDRQKASEALTAAEEAASSLAPESYSQSNSALRSLQLLAGMAPRLEFFGLVRLFMAETGSDILTALGIDDMKTFALVAEALFLQVRATQCASALRVLREEDGRSLELKGKVVAEEVAKERYFLSLDPSMNAIVDPRLLAVEFIFGIMLREPQVQVLHSFINGNEDAWVHQMLMGGGKTCVVAPITAALLSTPTRLFVAIVPPSLLTFSRQQLRSRLCSPSLGLPVLTFEFSRETRVASQLLLRLEHARRRRSAICASPQSIKSLLLRVAELAAQQSATVAPANTGRMQRFLSAVGMRSEGSKRFEGNQEQALQVAQKMLEIFRGAVALIDEIDWVMHPLKSELHWPCGPVRPLDLAEATVTSAESGLRWRITGCLVDSILDRTGQVWTALEAGQLEHKVMLKPNPVVLDNQWYFTVLLPLLCNELANFLGPRAAVPRDELLEFLGPQGRCGPTLTRLPDQETKLATLARQLLHSVLPHLLGLPHRIRYGLLSDKGTSASDGRLSTKGRAARRALLAVPFIGKDCPSAASEFAHPDVAIGLTIFSYHFEGLRKQDFVLLLKLLRAEMEEERGPLARRPSCLRWVSWVREAGGRVTGFSWGGRLLADMPKDEVRLDAPPAHEIQLEDGLEELRNNVWPLERVSLKDKHQVHVLWRLLWRSAGAVRHYLYEHVFPGVMGLSDSLLSCTAQELGSNVLFSRRLGFSGTPSEVLPASMGQIHYEHGCDAKILSTLLNPKVVTRTETLPVGWDPQWLLQRAAKGDFHALIDAGALIVGFSNFTAATKLLECLPMSYLGVVFLTEADESVVLLRDGRILPLADCGLSPSQRFTFYDHVHTTGLDVHQAPYAKAALTLGKDMLWRDYAQAAFRMRGLGPGAQTLHLLVPPEIRHLIAAADQVAPPMEPLPVQPMQPASQGLDINEDLISLGPVMQTPGFAQQAPVLSSGLDSLSEFDFFQPRVAETASFPQVPRLQTAHWTENSVEHNKELAAALRWTGCNTLDSDIKQFALLCEQNVEALWRSKAWAVVQGRGEGLQAAVGLGVSASLTVLRTPREDVIPNDPDPLVEERTLGERLSERLRANAHWITPEANQSGKQLIAEADGLTRQLRARRGAGSKMDQEQVQEEEQEEEQEQEQEEEQQQEEEVEQEDEEEAPLEQKYSREDEGETPWNPEILSHEPKLNDSSGAFYACCDGLSVFNGKLLQAQKCLGFPRWFLASQNYFRQQWRLKTVRRLKNSIMLVEWAPGGRTKDMWQQLQGVTPEEAIQAAVCACELDGTEDLTEAQAKSLLECLHLSPSTGIGGELRLPRSVTELKQFVAAECPVCPIQPGRHFCLVSLIEAEHLRAVLHLRPPFPMGIALRSPSALENQPLDTSNDFSLGPPFQAYAAAQLCRFVDSEASFSSRELCSVDLNIKSPHDERMDWWEHVRRCRRRAQARPVPSLSVSALLLPPSIRYKARLESSITKVKAVLRRRGTSAKQLFALQAGRKSLHMSVHELAQGLQQFGLLDQAEAGRLALAAAKFERQSFLADKNLSVSLENFVKLMGTVPGSLVEDDEDDHHATIDVASSPSATLAETQINLEVGRWAIKIVPHDRTMEVWSSKKVPGTEARPFSIWRPDLKSGAAAGGNTFQQGLRNLVGAGVGRPFLLGDIGKKGHDAPNTCLVAKIKLAKSPPRGAGLGLGLEAWMSRFLPRPVAFRLLWHDRRGSCADAFGGSSPGGEGLYVWRPVPPSDLYVALGAVCTTDASEPRGVDVRCVPRAWLVRGDTLGPALWSLGDRHEVKVQEGLGGVIACPTENLRYLPCWAFISDKFFVGT